MPILDVADFAAALPNRGALIGIDPGAKRIGLGVSDPDRVIASPLSTLARARFADTAAALLSLADARAACGFVVGLPLNMDGGAGPAAQAARAFARNLIAVRDWPLLLWDERWSSTAVTRQMIEADMTRKARAKVTDQAAAAYTLQGALDRLKEMALRADG